MCALYPDRLAVVLSVFKLVCALLVFLFDAFDLFARAVFVVRKGQRSIAFSREVKVFALLQQHIILLETKAQWRQPRMYKFRA